MRAGRLRHQIQLQSTTDSRDGYGETSRSWATYATVWAEVMPIRGKEVMQADQPKATATHRITIRYNSSVAVTDRILFDSRYFHVNAVRNLGERDSVMELECTEAI